MKFINKKTITLSIFFIILVSTCDYWLPAKVVNFYDSEFDSNNGSFVVTIENPPLTKKAMLAFWHEHKKEILKKTGVINNDRGILFVRNKFELYSNKEAVQFCLSKQIKNEKSCINYDDRLFVAEHRNLERVDGYWLTFSDYYKSMTVKEITEKDINEIYQLRELLEGPAFHLIFTSGRYEEYSYRIEEKIVRMCAVAGDLYEWEIADTANSFYQAIDVDFGNGGNVTPDETPAAASVWSKTLSGQVAGNNLNVGDKVIARFFDANGEIASMATELTIASAQQGDANQWAYDLAQKINSAHHDVRTGVKDESGDVSPVHGANSVFVKEDSTLKSVAISYEEQKAVVNESIAVTDLHYSKVTHGAATVTFHVNTQGDVNLEAHVLNHPGAEKGYLKQDMNNSNQDVTMNLTNVTPGHHMLKYYATNKAGTLFAQDVLDMMLEGEATSGDTGKSDFIFPDNLASYKAGTVVLQPKDGKTYECKPFPYSGYCKQYSSTSTQFEPGVGSDWKEAWMLKN